MGGFRETAKKKRTLLMINGRRIHYTNEFTVSQSQETTIEPRSIYEKYSPYRKEVPLGQVHVDIGIDGHPYCSGELVGTSSVRRPSGRWVVQYTLDNLYDYHD